MGLPATSFSQTRTDKIKPNMDQTPTPQPAPEPVVNPSNADEVLMQKNGVTTEVHKNSVGDMLKAGWTHLVQELKQLEQKAEDEVEKLEEKLGKKKK